MQLNTIEMPKHEATARLREYQDLLADERTAEDERIAAGYRAAARGLPVIHLADTVHAGGYFDNELPRIAVVRADATHCWFYEDWPRSGRRSFIFSRYAGSQNRGAMVGVDTVRVSVPGSTRSGMAARDQWRRARTIVPTIPPQHRPKRRRLHRFHILWEVEAWEPIPPRDPALLKHIGGDLWAVMAVWDLTDLERAVLSGRA